MLDLNKHLNSIKSILCLNGDLPTREYFLRQRHLPLIATDGAGIRLLALNVYPNVIIGDFDSINSHHIPAEVELLHISEQSTNDYEKALNLLKARQLLPCLVYGATGLESDHNLYNLQVTARYSVNSSIIIHDSAFKEKDKYCVFVENMLTAKLEPASNISLFAFVETVVSSTGLVWELNKFSLNPLAASARNRTQNSTISITIHQGQALVCFDYIHN